MSFNRLRAALVLACAVSIAATQSEGPNNDTTLPSPATVSAIEALSDLIDPEIAAVEPVYRSLQAARPQPDAARLTETVSEQPFVESRTMFLLFEPDTTETQVRAYINDNNIIVVRTFPTIGAIQVNVDLDQYLEQQAEDRDQNDALLRGLTEAVADFSEHPIVRSASPGILMQEQSQPGDVVRAPTNVTETNRAAPTETIDWGIVDIEADELWNLPGARGGVIFGVMDTGFAPHEDLVFLELDPDTEVSNHGNHVAGIACAQHNGLGVRGVLPSCFVRARSAEVFFQSVQGPASDRFAVVFAQILAALTLFIESQDDVYTFNVSMGYNWRSNFGINPDLITVQSERVRSLVESQGAFLVPFIEAANRAGKVIYSAAGNDSYGLADPITARYASPFNWAALTAQERGIMNGVVVEAHDETGRRAEFSNVNGNISCPGVRVRSSVAFGRGGSPSESAYGVMSGTSMASPYCAAGQALFRLVLPEYSAVEAINCMVASSEKSSSGTPMLRLSKAREECVRRAENGE